MIRSYGKEIRYELLKAVRLPAYTIPTLLFPIFFYLFFGIAFGAKQVGGVTMAKYLIATYGAFGVIGASLFGFGVLIAVERGQGWLEAKRTTPMPIAAYFTGKLAMAMLFSATIVLLLFTMGIAFGGVSITFGQAASLFTILVTGSITFCAFGLAVGNWAGPNSAAAICNLLYLPMSFLSGLWVPLAMLPKPVQQIALFLPPYHFSQLALNVIGAGRGAAWGHVGAMAIATVLFLAIAYAGYRRDEGKMYG
ncbi:MAG: type transport system permease protein [Acidobacteriota bacterium]|nr:type transport system permease protein [Acidobacteriota bacterium]